MKTVKTQYGKSFEADFEEDTWSFKMEQPFKVWAGDFALVDRQVYDSLISTIKSLCLSIKAHPDFTGDENDEWGTLTQIAEKALMATVADGADNS